VKNRPEFQSNRLGGLQRPTKCGLNGETEPMLRLS